MLCPTCKSKMTIQRAVYQYRESGLENVWLENWPVFVCPRCELEIPLLPDPVETAKTITRDLVLEKGPLDGDSIVFLRKAMGLATEALAERLRVNRVTLSRWENNKRKIAGVFDFRLRYKAIDGILPKSLRHEVRDAVTLVLENEYSPEGQKTKSTIRVPAPSNVQVFDRGVPASSQNTAGSVERAM